VRLIFPDQFPEVPAWVEPQDDVKWSPHQYGKGTLCLQLRPDNWVASATGADVLRSAYELFLIEDPLGDGAGKQRAPSEHSIGELQAYDWNANPVLISAGCLERLRSGETKDLRALRWLGFDDVWPIMVHDEQDRKSARRPPGPDINTWRFEIPAYFSTSAVPAVISDRASLTTEGGFDIALSFETGPAVVLFANDESLTAFHLLDEGKPHRRNVFVLPDHTDARSGRATTDQQKRIAIVGAGSVGSKLAESLVRSGAVLLTIVDGDVMLPGNLERHTLDWRDVGFRKVHGLKRRLLNIAPGSDIEVVDVNLSWQRSARTHAWQVAAIADCSVIVDATGDAATALFLGAIAAANNRAFVSLEVFEGGIGGLVASCLPERDPPFVVARAAFLNWCAEQGVEVPKSGDRGYEALAADGSVIVADDAAVSMTASHAARVVLDIIDGQPAEQQSAWLLLGYKKAWLFEGHGHTRRMSVGSPVAPPAAVHDEEALSFVMALVKENKGEGEAGQ